MLAGKPIVGLFLAAGRGRRFAHDAAGANKLFAPLPDGRSVVEAALMALRPQVDEVIAIVHPGAFELQSYLRRNQITTVVAPDAALGMGHSLSTGVGVALQRHVDLQGVVVMLADMPWVTGHTIASVVHHLRSATEKTIIVRPRYHGHIGHPVGFGLTHLPALAQLTGDMGARDYLRAQSADTIFIDTDDYGCAADVDRPTDIS